MTRFSRRTLLRGLGAAVGLGPLVPILSARAQEVRYPKRLIVFYSPDGVGRNNDWEPSGSETDFTLSEIHEPLQPFAPHLIVPVGLRLDAEGAGEGHAYGMGGLWTASYTKEPSGDADFDGGNGHRTGWGSGPSVDQVVANAYGENCPYQTPPDDPTPEVPYRTLELGAMTGDAHIVTRMIYAGEDRPLNAEDSPVAVFDRLFGEVGAQEADLARVRTERRSVIDLVRAELTALQGRTSAADRMKIDAHLEGVRAIERRLELSGAVCDLGDLGGAVDQYRGDQGWHQRDENFPEVARLQMDLMVRALACDLTRVASLQLSRGFSGIVHTWAGVDQGHHELSHDESYDTTSETNKVDRWYSEQLAYLLGALQAVPEGEGTMLDNTLLVWGRELARDTHDMRRAPFVIAGSAGGAIRPGRMLTYEETGHSRMLLSICHAMGLTDLTSFGNLDAGNGPLSGWT